MLNHAVELTAPLVQLTRHAIRPDPLVGIKQMGCLLRSRWRVSSCTCVAQEMLPLADLRMMVDLRVTLSGTVPTTVTYSPRR